MKTWKVHIDLSDDIEAENPRDAIVCFVQKLDMGLYDETILKATVEEVKPNGPQH